MKKLFLLGGAIAAVMFALVVSTVTTRAATDRYKFIARGIVTSVDQVNGTVKVDVNKATPAKAKDDLEGKNKEFVVDEAKTYLNTAGKDKRVTYKNIKIGQEIGMKGTAKSDDKYELYFVRIHDRSFQVVGLLKEHNEANRTLRILVTSSTYKPTVYKHGIEINLSYPENATFYEKTTKTPVSFGFVDPNDQKVRVTGVIENSSTWQVKTLIDHFK